MEILKIKNYIINTPLDNIIYDLRNKYPSHKLNDIRVKSDEIILTCVNSAHADGCEAHPDAHINLDPHKAKFGCYHCFACDTSTDFTGFIALYFDSTRDYAEQWLISNYGERNESTVQLDDDIKIGAKYRPKKTIIDESILDNYQTWCPYMAKRKLSRATCEKFKLRYDPKTRQIIFPAYDKYGHLVMLPERAIDYKMFYLNKEQEKPVYCLDYVMKNNIKKVIITEGPFDTLTCYEYGWPAIGTLGTISTEQIEQINNSCITTLLLMFDNDEAGKRFAEYTRSRLNPRIITEYVQIPKPYKDINDLPKEVFDEIIQKFAN